MNKSELEETLRRLKPSSPSAGLELAVARDLAHAPEASVVRDTVPAANERESIVTSLVRGLPWAIGGAAAAVMVMTMIEASDSQAVTENTQRMQVPAAEQVAAGPREFRAESPSREILRAVEGDVILAEQEEPTRLVRVNSLERRTWSNPHTGAQIAVELPREDLLLVPVAYQ